MRLLAASLALLALGACAAPGPQRPSERIERMVRGVADPGKVATTDIAFARAAREDGQWTAFRAFAARDAAIHGRNGPITADPWLAAQEDPAIPVQWTPLAIWSSCDGQLAVSRGKFADPDGNWGYYVTAWERQRDYTYRWTYDMGGPDTALTAQEAARNNAAESDADANLIVVTAIPMIQGEVADCPAEGATPPPPPQPDAPAGASAGRTVSADGTLAWNWAHHADGRRVFTVQEWREGAWRTPLTHVVGPDGKHIPQ